MSAESGISLRIHQDDFYRRAIQQISRRATAGRGTRWSSEAAVLQQSGQQVLGGVLGQDLHAGSSGRPRSATRPLGVLRSASLAVCTIGQGLAAARGLNPKHATKQVDRLLSNPEIKVDDILVRWVPFVVGARSSIVVALDWTGILDLDRQATIMLSRSPTMAEPRSPYG